MKIGVVTHFYHTDSPRRALGRLVGSSCLWLSLVRVAHISYPIAPRVVSSWAFTTTAARATSRCSYPTSNIAVCRTKRVHTMASMGGPRGSTRSFASSPGKGKAGDDSEEDTGNDTKVAAAKPKNTGKRQYPKAKIAKGKETKANVSGSPVKKRSRPSASQQRITHRDPVPKLWNPDNLPNGSSTFKIVSWNVAGLRALMRKLPDALSELVTKHDIDVLCLQEHKLQEIHLDDPKLKIGGRLLEAEGYDAFYNFSTTKKGYSGTACFVKRRSGDNSSRPFPTKVSYGMGKDEHDAEGRILNLEFDNFSLSNVYVPNSGQTLQRLDYRTERWDKDFLAFQQGTRKERGVPVMWVGDLNVAHQAADVWNDGAPHLKKQAGVTAQERASFQEQLDSGFLDVFRQLHPTAQGHYSYWSGRSGNREPNKGLRLDYFICSPEFLDEKATVVARDCYMLHEQDGSDHCPVVLELEIKK